METVKDLLNDSVNYIHTVGIADIIDILIVTVIIYEIINFIRKTNSSKVAKGIVILLIALWASDKLNLTVVNFLLRKAVELGLLALVVLFQPELRRALEKVGSNKLSFLLGRDVPGPNLDTAITQTVIACAEMARTKTGALIIFERDNSLQDPVNTGTIVDAATTAELLKNIFYPKAPLHDGAVIICDGRIAAAGCMLPLSNNVNLSKDLGMRHRAGIGISEKSDAVVVIVSEETGSVSIAVEGMLKRHLSAQTCEMLLRKELMPDPDVNSARSKWRKPMDALKVKINEKSEK